MRAIAMHGLGVFDCYLVPAEAVVGSWLMPRQEVSSDTRFVGIATRLPRTNEVCQRRWWVAVHGHPGSAEPCSGAVTIDH